MRSWVVGIVAALILIAAFLLLRGGAPEGEEARVARRGIAPGERSASGERLGGSSGGKPLSVKPAMPNSGAAADRPGSVRDGGETRDEKGEALVIPGAGKAGIHVGAGGGREGVEASAQGIAGGKGGVGDAAGGPLDYGAEHGGTAEHGNPAANGEAGTVDESGVPGVVFTSDDDKQYMTNEPVDLPDSDKLPRDTGSVNFWLEPGWEGDNQDDADFIDLGDGGLRVVKNVNYLRFEYMDANGVEGGVGVEISNWKPGEARQVTATWDGSNINLFVDGKLVSQRPNPGLQHNEDVGPVIIGSAYPPDRPIAPGVLSQVQLFNRPLDPGEISSIQRKKK